MIHATRLQIVSKQACTLSSANYKPKTSPTNTETAKQVTKSSYTADEDFSAADQVTEELGEDGDASSAVTLSTLAAIVRERARVSS